jgi:hypothetical protein
MKGRAVPRYELPFSRVEEAQLRVLVFDAFALRNADPAGYAAALQEIEDWYWRTLPDRIARFEAGQT